MKFNEKANGFFLREIHISFVYCMRWTNRFINPMIFDVCIHVSTKTELNFYSHASSQHTANSKTIRFCYFFNIFTHYFTRISTLEVLAYISFSPPRGLLLRKSYKAVPIDAFSAQKKLWLNI